MDGHGCGVTIEGDGGGGRILCNHLDGFSDGNIIPLHIDLPLDCDKPCFLIHQGVAASPFDGDGKPAVGVGLHRAVFRVSQNGNGNIRQGETSQISSQAGDYRESLGIVCV